MFIAGLIIGALLGVFLGGALFAIISVGDIDE